MATNNFGFQTLTGSERAGYNSINDLVRSIDSVLYTASTGLADGGSSVGQLLRWNGTTWAPSTIDGTSIDNNAVELGTKTTGAYVRSLAGTTNQISVTSNNVESSDVTVSIPSSPVIPGTPTVASAPDFTSNYTPDNKIVDTDFVLDALAFAQTGTSITLGGTYLSGVASSADLVTGSIPSSKFTTSVQQSLVPVGSLMPYVGTTAPSGWYLCDGSSFASKGLSAGNALYDLLVGAGWSALPDLRGRTVIGAGTGTGLTARTLAGTVGAETHSLTTGELASHTHTGTTGNESAGHTHSINHDHGSVNSSEAGAHGHNASTSGQMFYGAGANQAVVGASVNSGGTGQSAPVDVSNVGNHSHSVDLPNFTGTSGGVSANHTHSFTTDANGSGTAHNNMQPSLVMNYIIKG